MDTSTIISLFSLLIALLALPTNYWVAVRQVKVSLEEHDRRSQQRACSLVAHILNEFLNVFSAAVREITGIHPHQFQFCLEKINPHMKEIDAFVGNTQVLSRLAVAIDSFSATSFADSPRSSYLVEKLQTIRNQIALGSDTGRYATLGVIAACDDDDLLNTLRTFRPGSVQSPL